MKVTIRNFTLKAILAYDLGKLTPSIATNLSASGLIINEISLLHGFVAFIPMQSKNFFDLSEDMERIVLGQRLPMRCGITKELIKREQVGYQPWPFHAIYSTHLNWTAICRAICLIHQPVSVNAHS